MLLQRFQPPLALRHYIEGILVQEDFNPTNFANLNPVQVLPTAMTVIGIQYGKPMKRLEKGEAFDMGTCGITGMQSAVREYIGTGAIGTLIIQFKPGGLSQFTKYPLHEFQNANVPLELVFPQRCIQELEERLAGASDAEERVGIAYQFLHSVWRNKKDDQLIMQSVQYMLALKGAVSIERLAEQVYISKRSLERKFNAMIGTSPKQFASIIRFQHSIQLRNNGYDYLDIVQACGYSDHAHFAKDFKSFAGCTPEHFFNREVQPELTKSFNQNSFSTGMSHHMYH